MTIRQYLELRQSILMEGALGERLKREYGMAPDPTIAWASLIETEQGKTALAALWQQYAEIAKRYRLPFMATTPTRRANCERVNLAGRDASVIWDNVEFLRDIQKESGIEMFVGGLMGCKGDAYNGEGYLEEHQAQQFHSWQANEFRSAGVDFLYAGIMPTLPETIGMARAMSETDIPYIISFTIEKNGRLIDGTPISEAIMLIDGCVPSKPLCYMTNCVHPAIAYEALSQPFNRKEFVRERFLGIQGNTSPLPYSELDGAVDLKCSDPAVFAAETLRLKRDMGLIIIGGCCGTDNRHIEYIAKGLATQ